MWTRNNFNRNFASNFSSSQKKTLIIKTKCTCCFNKLLYFTLFGVCLRACRAKLWETFLRSSFITSKIWSPGRRRPSLKAAPKIQNYQTLNLVKLFLYFFKMYLFFFSKRISYFVCFFYICL